MTDTRVVERDRYAVLLHVYTLTRVTPIDSVSAQRIMKDLGLSEWRIDVLVRTLMKIGFLEYGGGADAVRLTRDGIDYIERRARRRKSVRLESTPLSGLRLR